jgi:copper(I)-binding protein
MPRFSFHGFALAMLIVIAGAIPAAAENSIIVDKAWSRATPKGAQVAVGYFTIVNHGDEPDRLVSVSAPFAARAEIHEMSMTNGMMQMRPVPDGVAVPAKGAVVFAPEGYHIMFMQFKDALKAGDTFPATLTFAHAGSVDVTFHVESMGAMAPAAE